MAQQVGPLVQESLSVGTERVWVTAPGRGRLRGTQIGLHTVARGQRAYTSSWTPGSIAAGGKASTTVTVPDAVIGDVVRASHSTLLKNDLRITAHVSDLDTVTVVVSNPTDAAITVPAGTARVIVFAFPGAVATTVQAEVYFTWTQSAESATVSFTAHTGALTVQSYDWDFGEGAGYQLDAGNPINNAY